jgi:RNA polymerase sigma factor (sigma-70 family)
MAKHSHQEDNAYFQEIERYPQLSEEQERLLAQHIQAGDKLALQQFVESNLRLVISIAKKYTGRGMDFMDLIQEGNLALVRAAKKFDVTRGYRFSTYGWRWIEESLINALCTEAQHSTMELSEEVIEGLADVEAPFWERDGEEVCHPHLLAAFACLTDREREVLVLRYGLDGTRNMRSPRIVADLLGISEGRVRQVEANSLRKLRAERAALADYWQQGA